MPPISTYRTGTPYSSLRKKPASSRYAGIGFVVLLHVVLLYALAYLVGRQAVETVPKDVEVSNIDQPKPKEDQIPPPPPKLETPPPPFVPPPDINISAPVQAAPTAIVSTSVKPPPPAPPAPPAPKQTVAPKVDRAHTADTERYYPPISKRLGEEGTVVLQVLVAADGHILDARVGKSSGYARLDNAAVDMAKQGGVRFFPGTADGQPAQAWTEYAVVFRFLR